MAHQTLIIKIEENLARRIREFLSSSSRGYRSPSEFFEVAAINQLDAEGALEGDQPRPDEVVAVLADHVSLLSQPPSEPPLALVPQRPDAKAIYVLTNRLSPVKVAVRVLANLAGRGYWPPVAEFQQSAALAARALGQRIRDADKRAGRTGQDRRWVAFPISEKEQAALQRYIVSFTISTSSSGLSGPMKSLGLGDLVDGKASLTSAGWELAHLSSPLLDVLDPTNAGPLSEAEAALLRSQVKSARGERAAVLEFLSALRKAGPTQDALDQVLFETYPHWTRELVVSHRAAMIGRLRELRVLDVSGRGPSTRIEVLDTAEEFAEVSGVAP